MNYMIDGTFAAFDLLFNADEELLVIVQATVFTSTLAVLASFFIGAPIGFILGYANFPGRKFLRLAADTMLCFPTVVIGLVMYGLLSRQGILGDLELLFTLYGITLGQTFLGLPIIIALSANAVENMDSRLRFTLKTLGANSRQILLTTLYEARYYLLMAAMAAYGRIVSEVGISMMIGGNIKWHTRTITTAITLETNKGQFTMGIALGIVLLIIAFGVNLFVTALKRMAGEK